MHKRMRKAVVRGIISAAIIVSSISIVFAVMSLNNTTTVVNSPSDDDNNKARVIEHYAGTTEIAGTPKRIVVLDTYLVEPLLALDIEPVGLAFVDIAAAQYPQIKQWANISDVAGESGRPNLEVVAQLEPDLILGPFWAGEMYEDLSDIAPTVLTNIFPREGEPDAFEQSKLNFMIVADAMGRHEQGAMFLEDIDAEFEEIKARTEAAGLKGKKFVFVEFHPLEDSPSLFIFHKGAYVSHVLEKAGLVNAVDPPAQDAHWGILDVGLEGLSTLDGDDVHLLHYRNISWEDASSLKDEDGIPDSFNDNPVWNQLSFVQGERVHYIDIPYVYGGPLIAADIANAAVDAMGGRE